MNIILCGLPMSGKTSIGARLAEARSFSFLDIDKAVEERYAADRGINLSCRQLCEAHGLFFFRNLEKMCISALKGREMSLIALGGGALEDPSNQEIVLSLGRLIYLKASPTFLWERTASKGIPSYLDKTDPEKDFLIVAQARMALFQRVAHVEIDVENRSIDDIVDALMQLV